MQKVVTKPEILITGATGQQGGAIAALLQQLNIPFRAMTRSAQKLNHLTSKEGCEVTEATLSEKESLKKALKGMKQAFLVTTPYEKGAETEVEHGINFVNAVKEAGVEHLLFSSVAGADAQTGIPHFETKGKIEQHIKQTGLNATILRPVFFMENFGAPWFLPQLEKGSLSFPINKNTKLQMTCLHDIGAFAVEILKNPQKYAGQTFELASDSHTLETIVNKISKTSGKPLTYKEMNLEESEKTFGHDFTLMFKWFQDVGFSVDIEALKQKWKLPLTSFDAYLSEAGWIKKLK